MRKLHAWPTKARPKGGSASVRWAPGGKHAAEIEALLVRFKAWCMPRTCALGSVAPAACGAPVGVEPDNMRCNTAPSYYPIDCTTWSCCGLSAHNTGCRGPGAALLPQRSLAAPAPGRDGRSRRRITGRARLLAAGQGSRNSSASYQQGGAETSGASLGRSGARGVLYTADYRLLRRK